MSTIFGNGGSMPGCFSKQKHTSGIKGAVFTLNKSQYCVVSGFNFTRSDDFSPVKCIGDNAYINLFGKAAVAEMTVSLQLFLIEGSNHTGILKQMKEAYSGKRLATGHKKCDLSVGSDTLATGYVTSMTLSADSNELGLAHASCQVVSLTDR